MVGSVTSSTLKYAKETGKFLWYGQEWGQYVGRAYKEAKIANPKTSLFSFSWKNSYNDFFQKQASEAAKKTVKKGIKGFLSKIGGKIMPAFILVTTGMAIASAVKEGGIIEGFKELIRGASGYAGAALTALIAGIVFTNPVGLIGGLALSIAGFTLGEWAAKKVVGTPIAEQKEMLAKQQEAIPDNQKVNFAEIDKRMNLVKDMFNNRHCYDQYSQPYGFQGRRSFIG